MRYTAATTAGITAAVGGQAGGHAEAAGAMIDIEQEEAFIMSAKKVLLKKSLEERIV